MDFMEDIELYNEAMVNAYNVITKRVKVEDILIELEDEVEEDLFEFPLPFNPFLHEDISNEEIDMVVEHFSDLEEYEMCAELVSYKKNAK